MEKYHKIQTVFKRNKSGKLLEGEFSQPEFEYLAQNKWGYTEKINGFNTRIMFNGTSIIVAGRTNKDQLPERTINMLNKLFQPKIEDFKSQFNTLCLYGETYGAKTTQGSGNYRPDQGFVLFDIKIGNWWLQRMNVESIATQLNLDIVPIIGTGTISEMIEKTQQRFNSTWGNFQAEGIVARPIIELQTRGGKRIITKIKCKDFR
ncbi:MAG: RNA ligase family protein [Candidatus Neomarinimicrobiota bacterium]